MPFDNAVHEWRQAERRVDDAPSAERPAIEQVIEAIVSELRRRLGIAFTVDELVDFYDQGTGWTLDLAARVAPEAPWAWETALVTDAAFARFLHDATDYAGGRRLA